LAPYLHDRGTYYTPVEAGGDWAKYSTTFRNKVAADPKTYERAHLTEMGQGFDDIAPPNSVDMVLDTRNFHNWMDIGDVPEMLADIKRALKPGGILVIEDHRALDSVPQDPKAENGYVRQDFVIEAAKKSGFEFVEASELLANPKDTKNWPQGVWTLPPTFALGDKDHAKYAAVGEADNMLLKFRKPM
jgi:predicted methyltransferase